MMFDLQPSLFRPPSLTVSEITRYLRALLEADEVLQDAWVFGEVSNLARPASGHIYFTLKDGGAALKCVIWKTTAQRLRFPLQDGMAVEAHGAVSVYEPGGQYQLYVDALRPAGEGALYQEFIRLKARLEAEGLFDEEKKQPLPARPKTIGVVTSASGAALQDVRNTLGRRYPLASVILAPSPVQGVEAPPALVRALRTLERLKVDVILIVRGGGSLEDLWAFNDERVVRAVANCSVPVISGVGHETDFTLVDFAADLRAPTPTGAAVLATPDIADDRLGLLGLARHLHDLAQDELESRRDALDAQERALLRVSPLRRIQADRQRLDELDLRAGRALVQDLRLTRARLDGLDRRLAAISPLAVLGRGYALVSNLAGEVIQRVGQVHSGEKLQIRVRDGKFHTRVEGE